MRNFVSDDLGAAIATEEKIISQKLKALRVSAGLGCAEFADALDIEESDLQAYENGAEAVPASVIALVCALTGAPYEHFFGNADEHGYSNAYQDGVVAAEVMEEPAEVVN